MKKRTLVFLATALLVGGCVTSFEPALLPVDHPANPQAREEGTRTLPKLFAADPLTRRADARLSEHEMQKSPVGNTDDYTCPMHPEVHQDKPGQCPKCGMTLVKKEDGK